MNPKVKRLLFLLFNVIVAIFVTCILPYFPFALLWGWMPNYIFIYMIVLAICSVVWGGYIGKWLKTQPDD